MIAGVKMFDTGGGFEILSDFREISKRQNTRITYICSRSNTQNMTLFRARWNNRVKI